MCAQAHAQSMARVVVSFRLINKLVAKCHQVQIYAIVHHTHLYGGPSEKLAFRLPVSVSGSIWNTEPVYIDPIYYAHTDTATYIAILAAHYLNCPYHDRLSAFSLPVYELNTLEVENEI